MSTASATDFHAVLFPHRSLSRRGFFVVMAIVGGVLGVATLRALAIGAWPVAVFTLADILLVWGAFKLSYRSARAFEEVSIAADEVRVRKVTAAGGVTEHRFNAIWARLKIIRRDEGVVRLDLGSHGQWIVIGDFLNPDDRESFASAFGDALARARDTAG